MFNKLSLSEQVEDALRKEITEGRVKPGQRMNLADYQSTWNISSTPFRDAAKALEAQGFLTIEPRKGIYVAPMNLETMREIFDVRIALECMAVELAAQLVSIEEAERVRAAYQELESLLAARKKVDFKKYDRLVHELASEHCGNRRLHRLLTSQMDLIKWVQGAVVERIPDSYEAALPEHLEIMDAICKRDSKSAAKAMRKHLNNTRDRFAARMQRMQVKS